MFFIRKKRKDGEYHEALPFLNHKIYRQNVVKDNVFNVLY